MSTFRKTGSRAAIATEVTSLRWLTEAGGLGVVPLVDHGDTWLETERLRETGAAAHTAREAGRGLARTHAAGASHFGAPPPDLDPADARLAEAPHPMRARPSTEDASGAAPLPGGEQVHSPGSWGEFFAACRVEPYLRLAVDRGALPATEIGSGSPCGRLLTRLSRGEFDAPLPDACLKAGVSAARLHGDLWAGNLLWTAGGAVLIDPAAHGGHAETDLAELGVFSAPFLGEIYEGYREVSPLADGWRERIALHQTHMVAVHAALFGGHYGGWLQNLARTYG